MNSNQNKKSETLDNAMRYTHKFKAKPVTYCGHKFPSTLEWRYFQRLTILVKSGEVLFFLRQIPFHLPGGVKYIVDYQIFYADGTISFVDVKGMETSEFKIKKKIVEDLYPINIEIIKREDF